MRWEDPHHRRVNNQPWGILVVRDVEMSKSLTEATRYQSVYPDPNPRRAFKEVFYAEAYGRLLKL